MSARVQYIHVAAADLLPYVAALRALESVIRYPISDGADHFLIDHGAAYTPFFCGLGEAHFVLALVDGRPSGAIAGVLRTAQVGKQSVPTVYLCDLKVAAAYHGTGVAHGMFRFALGLLRQRRFRSWRLAYGAAMRGARGDVMRAASGLHPARLGSAMALFHVYFARPQQLAALRLRNLPGLPPGPGLDLSPTASAAALPPGILSTHGRKDLQLESTGRPWPLWHLPVNPALAQPSFPAYLRAAGAAVLARDPAAVACFALDVRLVDYTRFLEAQDIAPGAVCTVYGLNLSRVARAATWLHLATCEI